MLEYAAGDTRHLEALADILRGELEAKGRLAWAEEEWLALEAVSDAAPEEPDDPVVRIKGARDLSPRQVTALRKALEWRDEIARQKDRALFRVVADAPLIDAVARHPSTVDELADIKGFPKGLARESGPALLRALDAVVALPEDALEPYPRNRRRGTGRPPPELESTVERLKGVRNRRAEAIGLPRGTLLANAVLEAIARVEPHSEEELLAIEGMRRWKADVVGAELLQELRRAG
jgi:ribonuclease D